MKKIIWILLIILVILMIATGVFYTFFVKNSKNMTPNHDCVDLGCPAGAIYVGSVNSDKFYECDCHYADQIKSENIVCFLTTYDAESKGYTKSEC